MIVLVPTIALILVMVAAEGRKVSKSTVSKRTDVSIACELTVSTREYTECQAFCPVVRIGSPHPSLASECYSPPFRSRGGTHSFAGEKVG